MAADMPVQAEVTFQSTKLITVTFTNSAGTPTAPGGAVNFRLVPPGGTDTTVTSGWSNPSTGVYQRSAQFNVVGLWQMAVWVDTQTDAQEFLVSVVSALP